MIKRRWKAKKRRWTENKGGVMEEEEVGKKVVKEVEGGVREVIEVEEGEAELRVWRRRRNYRRWKIVIMENSFALKWA